MSLYNIYCDESCHLKNDKFGLMTLGAIWCHKDRVKEISSRISDIKNKHGIKSHIELKWIKISNAKVEMYKEIIDYFFDSDDLHFRGLVAKNKDKLTHDNYGQSHDDWYYKMYFNLIKNIISSEHQYLLMLDHKDTLGSIKVKKLHEVLTNSMYDFDRNIVKSAHIITSDTSTCLQLADIFAGALGYVNRELKTSDAKLQIIEKIKSRSRSNKILTTSTLPNEHKFNVFIWEPKK